MPHAPGRVDGRNVARDVALQLACRCCADAADAELLPLLAQVDVPAFLRMVIERHRIGPLVASRLRRLPGDAVPAALRAGLDAELQQNRLRMLKTTRSHLLLDRAFADAGVPWLPFKGLTLARRYYRDPADRQVNDLDLWVPVARLDAARAALATLGFRFDPSSAHWDLAERGPRHRAFLQRWTVEETHLSAEHGGVDLHWQLSDNPALFRLSGEALLAGQQRIEIAGRPLPVMRHADLLLYLCEHGGKHGWFRLKWLADLPRVLDHQPLDWPALFVRARALGCERSLQLGLALAERLFGWVAPPEVRARTRHFRYRRILLWLVETLLRDPAEGLRQHATMPRRLMLLTAATRLLLADHGAALRHGLWRLSLSPQDLRLLPLPDRALPLYRLLRPFLMIWRRVRHHWQQRRG